MDTYMGHSGLKSGPHTTKMAKNGQKMAICANMDGRMVGMTIVYWNPQAMGAEVQKGTQMDTYIGHSGLKSGPHTTKMAKNGQKMAICAKMDGRMGGMAILYWNPQAIGTTV